jgi:hypothetical protein
MDEYMASFEYEESRLSEIDRKITELAKTDEYKEKIGYQPWCYLQRSEILHALIAQSSLCLTRGLFQVRSPLVKQEFREIPDTVETDIYALS